MPIKFGPDDVRVTSQHILDSHNIIKGYVNLCYKNFNPESHRPEDCGRQFSFHPDPIEVEKVNITAGQGQRTDTKRDIKIENDQYQKKNQGNRIKTQ